MSDHKAEQVVVIEVFSLDDNETTARQGWLLAEKGEYVVEWCLRERSDANFDRRRWHEKLSKMIGLLFGFSSPENPIIVDIRVVDGDYIARLHT
mgnify:CR=1 FL=1